MTATVTISIEVELGWGAHDLPGPDDHLDSDRRPETRALERLLSTCDNYSIPLTFDVVGHLLLEGCSGRHSGPYPEGWFDADPEGDVDSHPQFYAPDLVAAIAGASTPHEICTHSFSHVLADEMPSEVIAHDLQRAIDQHVEDGLDRPRSYVPPRHQRPSNDVLESTGIDVVRVARPREISRANRFEVLWTTLFRRHPSQTPVWTDGILETPCRPAPTLTSPALPTGQREPHVVFRSLPTALRQALHERYLKHAMDRAVASGGHLHLWTHLYNLASDAQMDPVLSFFDILARERDAGRCRVATMCELPGLVSRPPE